MRWVYQLARSPKLLVLLMLVLSTGIPVIGQEVLKHPRVVELEDRMNKDAAAYIKSRFPDIPYMVTVRVDPLRREQGSSYQQNEVLPYYEESAEEIKDEWDNPQIPLAALINRVRRIQVSISIPSKLKEAEVSELKEGIYAILHLTPARDQVEILRRDWVTQEVPWTIIYIASSVLFSLLLGLLVINRSSAGRIAKALSDLKLQGANSGGGGGMGGGAVMDRKPEKAQATQELKFNDPIKMKQLANHHISFLVQAKNFPNHLDIFALDQLGKADAHKLGAVLAEFPAKMQQKLFAYSSGFYWIEAFHSPGVLDFKCTEVLQQLTQNPREGDDAEWEKTVLAVWRLNENRTQFLKSLPKDEAFALLADMPKAIAVSESRKAFPGSWAAILDPNFKGTRLSKERIAEIQRMAQGVLPLHDFEMLKRYRSEKELLDYIRLTDIQEERDIYGAAPYDSLVHKMRPPFFPIFDQSEETLQWFAPTISTDTWALALFNVPKPERAKIDKHFSEKQKFMLIEKFKRFDANPPEPLQVNDARELVGKALDKYLSDKKHADEVNSVISSISQDIGGVKKDDQAA